MKIKFIIQLLISFILLFSFKIGVVDTALILLISLIAINFKQIKLRIDINILFLLSILAFLTAYSGVISVLYGSGELIFFLKFLKTGILLFLLAIYFPVFSKKIDYNLIQKLIVYAVLIHSVIIVLNILSSDFRDFIYAITGYSPRGPAWSRSPGITISFNSTAIIHLTALFLLTFRNIIKNRMYSFLTILLVLISLLFLGRTMAFVGLILITGMLGIKHFKVLLGMIGIIFLMVVYVEKTKDTFESPEIKHILANYEHFIAPLTMDEGSGLNYYDKSLKSHIYFSGDIMTLLFGDSYAGHIGTLGGAGETSSDIGLINSVNANGLLITSLLYFIYIGIIYISKNKDISLISFIVILTIVLTFKETGFFTSNATTLLFILLLYQLKNPDIRKESHVRNIRNK